MGRRKREIPSSLELFLDTICNTFGGIVFLAILLSVIVQNRTRHADVPQNESSVSPEEAQALAIRSETLSNRLNQLAQLMEDLQALQPTNEDRRVDEVAAKLEETQKLLLKEIQQQKKLARELADQSDENSKLAQAQADLEKQAESARKLLADEKSRLKNHLDEQTKVLSLPRVESVSKQTVILMMRFGKVYRLFSRGTQVDSTQLVVTEDKPTKHTVAPRREAGWRLADVSHRLLFSQYMTEYPVSSYAVRAYIWPDSFEQFAELKRLLLEQNYQYELNPYSEGDSITFVRGSNMPMVQ